MAQKNKASRAKATKIAGLTIKEINNSAATINKIKSDVEKQRLACSTKERQPPFSFCKKSLTFFLPFRRRFSIDICSNICRRLGQNSSFPEKAFFVPKKAATKNQESVYRKETLGCKTFIFSLRQRRKPRQRRIKKAMPAVNSGIAWGLAFVSSQKLVFNFL